MRSKQNDAPGRKYHTPAGHRQKISTSQLLKDQKQIIIEHKGEDYILRITSQDKLILTK